jgi:predicted RecB family nuclease
MRCAYAWYLRGRGEVSFEETVSPYQLELIADGQRFHTTTEAALHARRITPESLSAAITEIPNRSAFELWIPAGVVEHPGRKIYGQPDAVVPADGALIPAEIKSHRISSRMDRIELTFYWLLLEEQRTCGDDDPHGVLLLRQRDGTHQQVDVELTSADFDNVMTYIARVRHGRLNGVRPRVCRCQLCRGPRREAVLAAANEVEDVTLINGISVGRADRLTEIGIDTWRHLLVTKPEEIRHCLALHDDYVGLREIERWKQHAHAYESQAPVSFGPPPKVGTDFIALDLEYTDASRIWLTGVAIVEGTQIEYHLLWAATDREQRDALLKLITLFERHAGLPVVTWAGDSADIPVLRTAAAAAGLRGGLDQALTSHIDLYQHALRTHRWPIPELGLKQLCQFLGITRTSSVRDGLHALALHHEMLASPDPPDWERLKAALSDYSLDDLNSLIEITRSLASDPPMPQQPSLAAPPA